MITYRDSNQDKESKNRYFLGVIELETGMKNMYVFPDVINERETAPLIRGILGNGKIIVQDHRFSSYTDYFLIDLGKLAG